MGLVFRQSVSKGPDEECDMVLVLDSYSGREGRVWNMLLGKVRVFVGIVDVIMGLSGRGGSPLKSNSDLYVSVIFLYFCFNAYMVLHLYIPSNIGKLHKSE